VAKIVLVTGGSRGIGAATCRLAASRGWAVCLSYRTRADAAKEIVADIESSGGTAVAVRADVSVEAEVIRLFETCDRALGTLGALVNNAAILGHQTRVESLDRDRLRRVFETNVFGAFACAREAVCRMSWRHGGEGGAIVNVSSVAARLGAGGEYVDYAASKGALDAMTKGLAQEVAPEGIRVNGVRPGYIYTDMHASGGEPGRVDRVKDGLPLRRGGTPEEVAHAIVWLLSDESSFTTGSFIEVAGGR
jgi:NAD(P)-dependent dehydrogenase (short-subunit alcohol dehydrogenase family)